MGLDQHDKQLDCQKPIIDRARRNRFDYIPSIPESDSKIGQEHRLPE